MRQIKATAATLLLFGSAQAADLPVITKPGGAAGAYGVSRADQATVAACQRAIAQWAEQYDPINIDIAMTGPVRGRPGADQMATLFVKIAYNRQGGVERRSATIECTVEADGTVAVVLVS
jgi:hypothetical protein